MPLNTILVVGPPAAGKTAFAQRLSEGLPFPNPPRMLRLRRRPGVTNPKVSADASANGRPSFCVDYCPERVFEDLGIALKEVRGQEKVCTILIECDADPALRYAFAYAARVFLLPPPRSRLDLFRPARAAADALRQVMDDTAAFASEIFGLFEHGLLGAEDAETHAAIVGNRGLGRDHVSLSPDDVKQFLATPLGIEIASRIQLQPALHGLAESDLVIVNTGVGEMTDEAEDALSRLDMFLARVGEGTGRAHPVHHCDLHDKADPNWPAAVAALKPFLDPPEKPFYA